MPIQRTADPGGVANVLTYVFLPAAPARGEQANAVQRISAATGFWKRLFSGGPADWPAIRSATVRLGQMPGGCLFSVEDAQGLVVIGGVGIDGPGVAWEKLTETVSDIRQQMQAALQGAAGIAELQACWQDETAAPAEGPWVAVVPMIGLRYYAPDADRIIHLAGELGADLLTLCQVTPQSDT